jgi:hypothetical protein
VNFQAQYNKFIGAAWCSKGKPEASSECAGVKRNFNTQTENDRSFNCPYSKTFTCLLKYKILSISWPFSIIVLKFYNYYIRLTEFH